MMDFIAEMLGWATVSLTCCSAQLCEPAGLVRCYRQSRSNQQRTSDKIKRKLIEISMNIAPEPTATGNVGSVMLMIYSKARHFDA